MATEPTDAQVLKGAIAAQLAEVHTTKIGKVQSYDPLTNTCNLIPVVTRPFNIGDGETDTEELPVIPNVPVIWPRAGGFIITMPIEEGDHVVICFTDESIADWRETGSIADPTDLRRMSLGSAVCIPGIGAGDLDVVTLPVSLFEVAARAAGMVIGARDSVANICWDGATITVGILNPATGRSSFVALADRTETRLVALETGLAATTAAVIALTAATGVIGAAVGSHTHNYAPGPGAPVPTTPAPAAPAPPGPPPPAFVPVPLPVAADVLKATGPLP